MAAGVMPRIGRSAVIKVQQELMGAGGRGTHEGKGLVDLCTRVERTGGEPARSGQWRDYKLFKC